MYRRNRLAMLTAPVVMGRKITYALRDQYTNDLAAGSVNGTAAVPGPGTRTVLDSAGTNLLLTGGVCQATRTGANDPKLSYGAITRAAGKILYAKRNDVNGRSTLGFYSNVAANVPEVVWFAVSTNVFSAWEASGASNLAVSAYTSNTYYDLALILRATGAMWFVKGGTQHPYWNLVWVGAGSSTASIYPVHVVGLNSYYVDEVAVPSSLLWLPSPLASDGMSAAATDGAGHAEATGLGAGGSGKAYTDVGTWGVSGGAKSCSALDTGIGVSTVDCGKADVIHTAALTRSAGNVGVVVRKLDSLNYVYAYHDGTNVTLRKVVGGSDSQVLAPTAATYSAGAEMRVICYGTKFRVFYNKVAVGAEQTISDADLQGGTGVGLFTSDTGNTFDNLCTYARGTGNEYSVLDQLN